MISSIMSEFLLTILQGVITGAVGGAIAGITIYRTKNRYQKSKTQ